ncbi:indoleamine 2,3-dioxygenase gamma type [Patellaria atrata CBS 101060]|uniref:Indoleamine 2,3-dioxygenase n=1 Tax=Patellaria atrata CBS 101060 TaxID=1346257 RepID=A0A9P4VNS0_9PEZI|nr:indoleamine 2,3-dioxygenase gamma type [Patellaria atrata CBS 101060]
MEMQVPLTLFNVLTDPFPDDITLPSFMVSTTRGFLPRQDPVIALPSEFQLLESILRRMPITTASGAPGLLAKYELGDVVLRELPDLSPAIWKYKDDLPLMNALYRDYSFLASAYLLEPCHHRCIKGEGYGLGRQTLPKNISLPIVRVAELAGFKPFMEYAGSYALYNYRLEDPSLGLEYNNLRLIRAFEHGLDPISSEAGFVLVHVAMVKNSPLLVSGAVGVLNACASRNRDDFNKGLSKIIESMTAVNKVMNTMWSKSKPNDYTSFRTFIFGITKQSMFPSGVVYEGVSEEPMSFRGESGANDSMVPLCDNLLQIEMPQTPLTDILKDFRSYRPGNHREFLEWVKDSAETVGVKSFATQDTASAILYLSALDQVRDFRWRHWCFTREYILKHTSHPTATGGSPIVTWLPNQLTAVLAQMNQVGSLCGDRSAAEVILSTVRIQQETLRKEVQKYGMERGVAV